MIKSTKKRFALLTALILLFGTLQSVGVLAAATDKGAVLYTDIRASINGSELPYYLLDTNTAAVAVTDLTNYGFDLSVNNNNRTATLTFNPNKAATPLPVVEAVGKVGNVAYRYFTTDWVVIINGKAVNSYNIAGRLSVAFSELDVFGTRVFNNSTRVSALTTKTQAPQTPSKAGSLLYSQYQGYIGANRIPVYTLNGTVVVLLRDLERYGFAKTASGAQTQLYLDSTKTVNPAAVTPGANGTAAMDYFNANSTVYIAGRATSTYALSDGSLVIAFQALEALGALSINGTTYTFNAQGASATVSGRVTDASGNGISGAAVAIYQGQNLMPAATRTTGYSGDYSFTGLETGKTYYVESSYSAQGYASNKTAQFTLSGDVTKNLTLTKAATGTVSVTVRNSAGAYLNNATVQLYSGSTRISALTTNSSGTCSFTSVAPGTYTLQVSATSYETKTTSSFTVTGNGTNTQSVQLAATGATVSGQIYLPANINVYSSSATVEIRNSSNQTFGSAYVTLTPGGYVSFSVPLTSAVTSTQTMFARVTYTGTNGQTATQDSQNFTIATNSTTVQAGTITLTGGGGVPITVYFQNTTPNYSNVTVTLYSTQGSTTGINYGTATMSYNNTTTYSFNVPLTSGYGYNTTITAYPVVTYYANNSGQPRTFYGTSPIYIYNGVATASTLYVTGGNASISGYVNNSTAANLTGVAVRLRASGASGTLVDTTYISNNQFAFQNVADGYYVCVIDATSNYGQGVSQTIYVSNGVASPNYADITLTAPGFTVSGRVIWTGTSTGVTVVISSNSVVGFAAQSYTVTANNGTYTFYNIPAGNYTFTVYNGIALNGASVYSSTQAISANTYNVDLSGFTANLIAN